MASMPFTTHPNGDYIRRTELNQQPISMGRPESGESEQNPLDFIVIQANAYSLALQ